ncbi:MAG: carboxypeptidase-like regulatory domain-containing protein, partial [Pedobacter sp.]|nr:carboxypeptidase-like regulatory domain-containing protein [Pedobacter sp.]
MKSLSLTLLLFLLNIAAFAHTKMGTIGGLVVDEQSKPMDYVTVGLFKASDSTLVKTALTNPDGKFEFSNIGTGNYYIKTNMMGYAIFKSKTFALSEGQDLKLDNIRLLATSKALNAVNVTGTKPLIERRTDKMVMNVENSSILVGSTALEVLQKAPGVTVDQ